ncbi:DENN domain-containing protein 5A [Cichlidogyrus casuarinus]|uniref:DENN domain-containing protein 5A n=1 Tax=Cichlidogyrus casuarinus TaxID=1844966 RepID=A0ABD2QIB6_9PLAT
MLDLAFVDSIPLSQNSFHESRPANLCLKSTICRPLEKASMTMAQVHEKLAGAVNNLLKHFSKRVSDVSVTQLLCSPDNGLVPALENVFRHGLKSSRFFQRKLHVFDYFEIK